MVRFGKKAILAVLILLAGCSDNSEQEARDLVNNFYQLHQSARPNGALTLKQLITFRNFMSVQLFELLKDVSVAEEARQSQGDPDAPALVDGDLFTTNPKGATSYRLLMCQFDENNANCSTELLYGDAGQTSLSKSIDRIVLTRDARGWVIDNIVYSGTASSGQHSGDLQKFLQNILADSAYKRTLPTKPTAQ